MTSGIESTTESRPSAALARFFDPRSIALVGLSREAVSGPVSVLNSLHSFGYNGEIHVINPNLSVLQNACVHASINELTERVDLAVIVLPRALVLAAIRECIDKGIRGAIVITQGFADADQEGADLQKEMVRLAQEHDFRILGPNTMGLSNAYTGFTSSFLELCNERSPIGVISQSGLFMMGHHVINNEPAGFGMAVDIGNGCDIGITDILDYYGAADEIRVIQCHVEGIVDGAAFLESAARISARKPILVYKAGVSKTGQRAVASHSGAAAGENEVYRAAFRKAGLIRADNAEDLRVLSKAFATYLPPRGPRVAVISFSGGAAILAIDAIESAGLTLATLSEATIEAAAEYFPPWMTVNNPLDVWIGVSKDFHTRYPRILNLVLRDEGVDSVICIYPSFTMPKHALYDSARHIRQCAKDHPEKPVLCWSYGLDVAGFTKSIEADGTSMVFPSLGAACLALTKLLEYRAVRARRPIERPRLEVNRARAGAVLERARTEGRRYLFTEAFEILEAYGVALPAWRMARTKEQVTQISTAFRYPACMKITSSDIMHKSDVGGVTLNIDSPAELLDNYLSMMAAVSSTRPGAEIDGVLIQEMAANGKEVMVGVKKDPVFGHCLILGAGGVYIEILDDYAFRLTPISERDAYSMIDELWYSTILRGARGEPACDLPAIVKLVLRVSQLVCDHPEIAELDINPLIAHEHGLTVVDARIVT